MELKKEIESLLFSSGKMMKESELAELTAHPQKEVREALEALKKDYDERDTSLVLMNSGDSWKLNVREKYMGLVTKIIADTELPFPVLETLGMIAFKAPAWQADVVKARGTNAYEHVGVLVEAGFVEKKKEGRSFRLMLTPKFFEYFDVADHEAVKEALKDVKVPEQKAGVGGLEVVDIPPEEQKKIEDKEREELEKKRLGELEIIDSLPDSGSKETIDTIRPDDAYLQSIDEKIKQLSKKNDELDQDESFKRQDLEAELGAGSTEEQAEAKDEGEEETDKGDSDEEESEKPGPGQKGEAKDKDSDKEEPDDADEEGDEEESDESEQKEDR
jgi:segregation and condensation protein B